jgi:hypothetical protein
MSHDPRDYPEVVVDDVSLEEVEQLEYELLGGAE